jgi:hypothetical protein
LRGSLVCTAAFIATSDRVNAPVYVLTSGRCAADAFSDLSAIAVTVDQPVAYTVEFNYFYNSKHDTRLVNIDSVAYATMKGVDIAILKTDQTIALSVRQSLVVFCPDYDEGRAVQAHQSGPAGGQLPKHGGLQRAYGCGEL